MWLSDSSIPPQGPDPGSHPKFPPQSLGPTFLYAFFIKKLALSFLVYTFFDFTGNTIDETAATFKPVY